jgi:hypothetical protein
MIWRQYTLVIVEVLFGLIEIVLLIIALNVLGKDTSRTKLQKITLSLEIIIFPLIGPLFYLLTPKRKDNKK